MSFHAFPVIANFVSRKQKWGKKERKWGEIRDCDISNTYIGYL